MWELRFQMIALAVILTAGLVQLFLEYFLPKEPASSRRRWTYILILLVLAGAIANGIDTWQTHVNQSEARERLESTVNEREQQARKERQEISEKIQNLVTLARERNPNLTEQEALRTISAEVRTLRERQSQLEHELQGLRRYSRVAKYSALGLTGIAGAGLKENSPIARALEGAYIKVDKETGPDYFPRCDAKGLALFASVAREFPDFPFSHWALAKCLKQIGDPQWRSHAERAMAIFQHTTRISGHSPHHDQARTQMEHLLSEQ